MNYITTTQLRTQTPDLLEALLYGQSVDLIHRSKIVGEITSKKTVKPKLFDATKIAKITKEMNLTTLTVTQREKKYRDAMIKKHGKHIS